MTKKSSSPGSAQYVARPRAGVAHRQQRAPARMESAANDRCELCDEKGATGRVKMGPVVVIVCNGCAKAGMSVLGIVGKLFKR